MLTGKQKRFLRAIGHNLSPVVAVGKEGLGQDLYQAVEQALFDHELIKIKIGQNAEVKRSDCAKTLALKTKSQVAQILGSTILLYKKHPEKPVLKLPVSA